MKKPLKNELLKSYLPKFKSNSSRVFWLESYFREATEWYPDKDIEYWVNELLQSPKAMYWVTKKDIDKAIVWFNYCKAHNR